jgi:hypothetical protein
MPERKDPDAREAERLRRERDDANLLLWAFANGYIRRRREGVGGHFWEWGLPDYPSEETPVLGDEGGIPVIPTESARFCLAHYRILARKKVEEVPS